MSRDNESKEQKFIIEEFLRNPPDNNIDTDVWKNLVKKYAWPYVRKGQLEKEIQKISATIKVMKENELKEEKLGEEKLKEEKKKLHLQLQKYTDELKVVQKEIQKRNQNEENIQKKADKADRKRNEEAGGAKKILKEVTIFVLVVGSVSGVAAGAAKGNNLPPSLKYLIAACAFFSLLLIASWLSNKTVSELKIRDSADLRGLAKAFHLPEEDRRLLSSQNRGYKNTLALMAFFGLLTLTLMLSSTSLAVQGSNPSKTPAIMILVAGIICAFAVAYGICNKNDDEFLLQSRMSYLKKKLWLPAVALGLVALASFVFMNVDPTTWLGKGLYASAILFMTILITFYCAQQFPKLAKSNTFKGIMGVLFSASFTMLIVSISTGIAAAHHEAMGWSIPSGIILSLILCYFAYKRIEYLAQTDSKREARREAEKVLINKIYETKESTIIDADYNCQYGKNDTLSNYHDIAGSVPSTRKPFKPFGELNEDEFEKQFQQKKK